MTDSTNEPMLRPMPLASDGKLLSSTDGAAKLPTIVEAVGNAELNPVARMRMWLRESKVKRQSQEAIRAEATSIARDIVLFKLHQDETYIKSRLVIEGEERTGALTKQVTNMVSEAIKQHTKHVFDFNLSLGEEEAAFLNTLNEKLKAGQITRARYEQNVAKLSNVIERDLDRAEQVFEQLIEDVITNFKALARR